MALHTYQFESLLVYTGPQIFPMDYQTGLSSNVKFFLLLLGCGWVTVELLTSPPLQVQSPAALALYKGETNHFYFFTGIESNKLDMDLETR